MPYTPPSRSPGAPQQYNPSHTLGVRPNLPRSNSSQAYLQKHRRSPSLPTNSQDRESKSSVTNGYDSNYSIRQTLRPSGDGQIPRGAILSPPDSSHNSDEDDGSSRGRHRADGLRELQEAVRRSLNVNDQTGSPENEPETDPARNGNKPRLHIQMPDADDSGTSTPTQYPPPTPPILSASARKISHSRSATEDSIFDVPPSVEASASVTASDDSDEDMLRGKPPLLRKKSGELVKPAIRPPSRRKHSSMPGTPTYSKAVHFNDNIEQVRHFLQVDRPIAVSAGASPVDGMDDETEFPFGFQSPGGITWDLTLKNFPRESMERMSQIVRVERIWMSEDQKSLMSTVAVANCAYQKHVVARFTLDYWKTTSEVMAEFHADKTQQSQDGYDKFEFSIKLSDQANLEARTMLLCVRYNVNGQDHWDNNGFQNFQIDFVKEQKPAEAKKEPVKDGLRGHHSIPRSRHNSSVSKVRPRSVPSFDDDFSSGFDAGAIKLRGSGSRNSQIGDMPARRRPNGSNAGGAHFSTRYDFGASLSAALSHAQTQLGDRSSTGETKNTTISSTAATESQPPPTSLTPRTGVTATTNANGDTPRPDTLLANRQSLDSRAYQEFVSKFCFFGSNKTSTQGEPAFQNKAGDGATDEKPSTPSLLGAFDGERYGSAGGATGGSAATYQGLDGTGSVPLSSNEHALSLGYFSHENRSGMITPGQTPTAITG